MPRRQCPMCTENLIGRSDKKFCSVKCKSEYHIRLRQVTQKATIRVDKILHRNRSILLEILGKRKKQINITRRDLDKKKFNFHYFTSMTINNRGKQYFHVYDFRYMTFSDDMILIVRK